MSSKKRKHKVDHIVGTGVNEKGEFSKTQKLILKTADSIFNSPRRSPAAGTKKKNRK